MGLPETATCPIHNRTAYLKSWGKYSHKDESSPKGYCNLTPLEIGVNVYGAEDPTWVNGPRGEQPSVEEVTAVFSEAPSATKPRDYDAENRGKCRCAVFCAEVQKNGIDMALSKLDKMDAAVEYMMTGAHPQL